VDQYWGHLRWSPFIQHGSKKITYNLIKLMLMTSVEFKPHKIRLYLACLIAVILLSTINACTVKHSSLEPGTIRMISAPSSRDENYGKLLYQKICKDYNLDSESQQYEKMVGIFEQLTNAAEVSHLPWHIYLVDEPEIVDIRAVHGNYIFVWSGIMDAVENDAEFAGLLAYELSHALARHTDPVKFTLATELLFTTAELATSVGIMMASQGAIAISGIGWMKWAYTEVADLDPMDREYSENYEREAADIALFTISRTRYSPQALLDFWKRVSVDESIEKYRRFSRSLSPQQRVAILEGLMVNQFEEDNKLAQNPTQ
jgi:predicted Zn-dependent protease